MAEILKHQQVITMMRQQNLDILVLTETRGKSYYTYNSEGYLFIVSGSVQDPYAGVTIVVAPRIRPHIQDVTQHSPRLSSVTIAARSGSMHILGVYAPHNKMDVDLLKIPFWDQLEDAFSKIPLPEPAYVLGDFNVRLQGRSSTEKEFLGPHILGKGMEFAQRKLHDNRSLFLDFLRGQESVDTITFKTPDLTKHVTYRDKTPPPQDWGAFILDPLGWIQTYDLIQHASQSDSRAIQIAHNIRQFLTATPIQQPPPALPSADPIRFQNLDKCVTRRKWLPTVHSVKAVHSTGFPSDHYLLKVEIQVKLGSKIPTPPKPPHRTYTKNSDYAKELRKFHAKSATPQGSTPDDTSLDVYTDGSGTAGKCSKSTPAGWGYVVLQEGDPIHEAYGPVITDDTSPFYCGASVGSNNTAELQAWMEVALFLLATPPKEVTFFYDSKWMANMVRGQARPKRHKQMVVNSRAILSKLAETTSVHWHWVKGHQGDVYNTKADELADKGRGSLEAQGGRYTLDNPATVFDVISPPSLPTGCLNNKLQQFISALRQAELKSFSVNKATPRQPWLPPELARDLETAKRMQANLDPDYPSYYKEVKKRARAAKRAWLAASLEANPDTTHPTIWKHLRKFRQGFSGRKRRLVVQGRQVPWSKTHEATRNHLHSSQWGPSEVTEEEHQILRDSPPLYNRDTVDPGYFTMEELQTALSKLRARKAPGPDGIRPELLLLLDSYGESQLLDLYNTCWATRTIPNEWKEASVITFYKGKGEDSDASNYRPISLLNTLYKVYASMIQSRLADRYDRLLRKTQFGFRRGKGTSHPLFILRRLQDYSSRTGKPFHLLFLDWRMAFDKVDHASMLTALERLGLHESYVDIIRDFYVSPSFYTTGLHGDKCYGTPHSGIRQGCPLSPYLFIMVMTVLMNDVDDRLITSGVPTNSWSIGKPTYDMEYADDTLLFGVTSEVVEEYLKNVQVEASLYGLQLNLTKTEHLPFPGFAATPLCFSNGEIVPQADKCKYLGTQVSWDDPTKTAINHRLQLAKAAYGKLAPFWRSKVPLAVKLRVFESNVVSVATYSLATLTLEDKHLKQIDSWYFSYLRRVVGVKASYYSRIPNKSVWLKAHQPATPSQTIMSAQFKLLTEAILTPNDDPFHHVMFSPGYTDRVGIQRNSKRGPPPPHWLGLTSQRALAFFATDVPSQPGYSSQTRLDLLGLKQYITKHPEYPARLAAAPTRSAETFNYFRSSVGGAWRS